MVRRVLLAFSVAAVVACGSFSTAPTPVEEGDGGIDGSVPTSDASFDSSTDVSVPPQCATPLVTDPNVSTECPGVSGKVSLSDSPANCGRCGYSCGTEECFNGLCVPRKETEDIEALLGVSNGTALVSTKVQIRGYTGGTSEPLAALNNEVPVNAVFSKGQLFFRTVTSLRAADGAAYAIEGGAPFLAPSLAGVVSSGKDNLVELSPPNVLDIHASISSPREVVAVGSNYVVYSATSEPSLRQISNRMVTELVPKVGKISALQAFGDYAYYARGREVFRVKTPAGSPELVATSPTEIKAYVGGPALSVTAEAIRFLASSNGTDFTLYEQEQCPGAQPRVVATPQNSKGVLVTADRVFWSESTNQLFSRAIAKKP